MQQTKLQALLLGLLGILSFSCIASLHSILSNISHYLLLISSISVVTVIIVKSVLYLFFLTMVVLIPIYLIKRRSEKIFFPNKLYISVVVLFPLLSIINYIINFGTSIILTRNIAIEVFASLSMYSTIFGIVINITTIAVLMIAAVTAMTHKINPERAF